MIELMREIKATGIPDGAADQQRPRMGAAVALDAAGRRDLRARRRLRLRRHAASPTPEIYELTLERLGDGIAAADCLFVDDVAVNVAAARELGITAVRFRDNDQAIPEIRAELGI